jgi:hypothetical protein
MHIVRAALQMHPDDESALGIIYQGAKDLFTRGEYDRAQDRFQSIYEADCTFRDVAEIVNDYYDEARDKWIAKYRTRFGEPHGTA